MPSDSELGKGEAHTKQQLLAHNAHGSIAAGSPAEQSFSEPPRSQADSMLEKGGETMHRTVMLSKATFFSKLNAPIIKGTLARSAGGDAAEEVTQEAELGCWAKTRNTGVVVGEVVRKHPWSVLLPPILIFVILCTLGVVGTLLGAQKEVETRREIAGAVVLDTAVSFKLTVETTFAPLITLNSFIQQQPNYKLLQPEIPAICEGLISQLKNSVSNLQFTPFGIIREEIPWANHTGVNLFAEPLLRTGAIATMANKVLTMSGPLVLLNYGGLSGIARLPCYISNVSWDETFGNPSYLPGPNVTLSTPGMYDYENRTKFWGFVTALIPFNNLLSGQDSRLADLEAKGYRYRLTRPDPPHEEPFVIAHSKVPPPEGEASISIVFNITNNQWTLSCYPDESWEPAWKWPVVAAVVVLSFIISCMVFVMLLSLKQQGWLLQEVGLANLQLAAATRTLEEEKARMDVMLVRQYNLIQCFSSPSQQQDIGTGSNAMDRIETMRRQLNHENVQSLAETEQIKTLEVLGEGTFGKVYKGLWRGSEVAVKTMMLPANMTGQEKREKMAIMEAAISSSLAHPNIVATYTYSIKPVKDSMVAKDEEQLHPGILLLGGSTVDSRLDTASPVKGGLGNMDDDSAKPAAQVHSYEVRLVLEFCDKGCLREALDSGAFFCHTGLNYKAILDTALDIAKAMTHLHAMNVLHSDLKARNVMLKCAGEARGFIAKVADFGLSVKMDFMETHMSNMFQGTLTHMSPEIMLEGRVSKAADVYAFGITLWELFTGGHPYKGTPRALMGHLITHEHKRPSFNVATPSDYRILAERCWDPIVDNRPTFTDILDQLVAMREKEGGVTEYVHLFAPPKASSSSSLAASPNALPALHGVPAVEAGAAAPLDAGNDYEGVDAPIVMTGPSLKNRNLYRAVSSLQAVAEDVSGELKSIQGDEEGAGAARATPVRASLPALQEGEKAPRV